MHQKAKPKRFRLFFVHLRELELGSPADAASPLRQPTAATSPASTGEHTPKVHQKAKLKRFRLFFVHLRELELRSPADAASPLRQPMAATSPASTGEHTPKVHQTRIKRTLMEIQSSFYFLQEIISD